MPIPSPWADEEGAVVMSWAIEGVVEVGGTRLAYLEAGKGLSLPVVVLIHGAGGSRKVWHLLLRDLSRLGLRGIAIELPGHGKSPGAGFETIRGYSRFVEAFLDAKGISNPILAGHSMGGAIALEVGFSNPEKLGGLVLIGTGARLRVSDEILDGLRSDFENTVSRIAEYAYSNSPCQAMIEEGKRQLLECVPMVVWSDFKACNEFDVINRVKKILLPTLVICGEEDILTPPKYSELLARSIPSARLYLVEHAGHMVMVEQPGLVGAAIREFAGSI